MAVRTSTAPPTTPRSQATTSASRPTPPTPSSPSSPKSGGGNTLKPGTRAEETTGSQLEKEIYRKRIDPPTTADIPPKASAAHLDPRPTRPPKNNGRDRTAHASHVRRQLGIPDHATSGAATSGATLRQLRTWVGDAAQAACRYLLSWPAEAADSTEPASGVIVFDHDFATEDLDPPGHTRGSLFKALQQIYPVDDIHFVALDPSCEYAYPRNLAGPGPDGVMRLADDPNDEPRRWDCARAALIEGFKQLNIAHRVVPFNINFADVTWEGDAIFYMNGEKKQGLLFISNAIDLDDYEQIRQAFGAPPYTVYANTNKDGRTMPRTASGQPGCYDADLGRSAVMTDAKHQRSTVVIYEPCFDDGAALNLRPDGRSLHKTRSLSEMMDFLGIGVIAGNKNDHARMVPNLIVSSYQPDKVLLPDPDTSKAMRHQLRTKAGRTAVFGEELLGHPGVTAPPFAAHCMTLELPQAPRKTSEMLTLEDEQAPQDKREL